HGKRQHRGHSAKSAKLVREIKGGDDRARASRAKHQTIQRDNKNSAVAFDLAIDKKVRRSITNSRSRPGNHNRAQKRESQTTSECDSYFAHKPALVRVSDDPI